MPSLSNANKKVIYAHNKGYRVSAKGDVINPKGGVRKTNLSSGKYLRFTINSEEKGKYASIVVHKLQAYQKYGEKLFEEGIEVRHLDGNRTNNSYENISIGTRTDNIYDIPPSTRKRNATLAGRKNSSLKENDIKKIRILRENKKYSYKQIMEIFPISKSSVSGICNYKTWKTLEFEK